ncbi:MAG: hypothetical protein HGB12_10445 [Bacteroidetes bacterium]|nr:hypothetical protein [Bacteroidota bacterium]
MKKPSIFLFALFTIHFSLFTFNSFSQGIGINTSGNAAKDAALLEVGEGTSDTKGLLIPRVNLTDVATYAPLTGTPVASLIVYSNTSPTNGNGAGYYYWDGSKWINITAPSNGPGTTGQVLTSSGSEAPTWATPAAGIDATAWHITGNTGIDSTTNFIGTSDASGSIPLRFKTRNLDRMIISSTGNVGIGTTITGQKLTIAGNPSSTFKAGYLSTDNILLSGLEGGAYFGKVGVKENQWGLANYASIWIPKDSPRDWQSIAMSSDGKIQTAGNYNGRIYVSNDYGATWTQNTPYGQLRGIAMSSDGKIQTTVPTIGGYMYGSDDYGATWTQRATSDLNWNDVAMSSDGKIQTAVVGNGGYIYGSNDFGVTWTQRTNDAARYWQSIAMSSDGKIQTAIVGSGQNLMFGSTDYGFTWTEISSGGRSWNGIAMSSDGKIQTASVYNGYIYVSTNYGATWTQRGTSKQWGNVAMSADGKIQTTYEYHGYIYCSSDYGITWTQKTTDAARYWNDVAMSSDGKIQTAVANYSDYIYVSSADSYISGGNVGIGTSSPTAVLQLKAGTNTANTAPLKFTAGANLSTTEAGAIEYDGSHLYFTATNGGTRYQLDQQGFPYGARAYMSASTQSVSASTWTTVLFDGETWDLGSEYTPSSGIYKAKTAGYYSVTSTVYLQSMNSGKRITIAIEVNGARVSDIDNYVTTSAGNDLQVSISDMVKLAVNDEVTIVVYHTDSGARTIYNNTISSFFAIQRLY